MIRIAPSILSADFASLGSDVKSAEEAGADILHIDVMDGHFVPNLTIGPMVVAALRHVTKLPLDVHLMIDNPDAYIPAFVKAGADIVTVHPEVCLHLHRTLQTIRGLGVKAGVALNPATPESVLQYVVSLVDLVLVMTVNPGFGGQTFIPEMLLKIKAIRQLLDAAKSCAWLSVDGGINTETVSLVVNAGADTLVAGSAIFGASVEVTEAITALRKAVNCN
ncbi:MAG: ribulose-phosphate 3-epimerase [Anaerolineae bacterium]|nr:ribulose-phosphate 3-epimerase [Anaerolineae bacterium]